MKSLNRKILKTFAWIASVGGGRFSAVLLLAAVASPALGALPSTNGVGVSLVRATAEADSYCSQSNAAGGDVEAVGAGVGSVDTSNSTGAAAYLGYMDPLNTPVTSAMVRDYLLGRTILSPTQRATADDDSDGDIDVADLIAFVLLGL